MNYIYLVKTFGLIGNPLEHSFSKKYFTEKFIKEGTKGNNYRLFPLEKASDLIELVQTDKTLCGLNVTIPFKRDVLALLDQIEAEANAIGAVNTIKIIRNIEEDTCKLIGYNTDVYGFKTSIMPLLKKMHLHALVLGTGGSARAVCYALKELGISCLQVSREPKNDEDLSYQELNEELIKQHTLIINCTPIGMFPDINLCPDIPFNSIGPEHLVYDLIYNPIETRLLKKCREKGAIIKNGMEMLELQAEKSWEIWNL